MVHDYFSNLKFDYTHYKYNIIHHISHIFIIIKNSSSYDIHSGSIILSFELIFSNTDHRFEVHAFISTDSLDDKNHLEETLKITLLLKKETKTIKNLVEFPVYFHNKSAI